MTRTHSHSIGTEVTSFPWELPLDSQEKWLLPKSEMLCILRYHEEDHEEARRDVEARTGPHGEGGGSGRPGAEDGRSPRQLGCPDKGTPGCLDMYPLGGRGLGPPGSPTSYPSRWAGPLAANRARPLTTPSARAIKPRVPRPAVTRWAPPPDHLVCPTSSSQATLGARTLYLECRFIRLMYACIKQKMTHVLPFSQNLPETINRHSPAQIWGKDIEILETALLLVPPSGEIKTSFGRRIIIGSSRPPKEEGTL